MPELAVFFSDNVHVCFRERLSGRLPALPGLRRILAGGGLGGSCWHFSPGIPLVCIWPRGRTKVSDGLTTEAGPQCRSNLLTRCSQVAETRPESGRGPRGGPCTLMDNSWLEAPKHPAGASQHSDCAILQKMACALSLQTPWGQSPTGKWEKIIQGSLLLAAPVLEAPQHVQLQSTEGLRAKQPAVSQETCD